MMALLLLCDSAPTRVLAHFISSLCFFTLTADTFHNDCHRDMDLSMTSEVLMTPDVRKTTMGCNKTAALITAQAMPEYQVAQYFHLYILPLIFTFGFIGNMLSLCIMMQTSNRRLTCCWYFAALSVYDNLVMLASLYLWANQLLGEPGFWMCRTYSYFVNLGSSTSCYLMLFITVDRYYAVCRALETPPVKTPSDARKAIVMLAIITCFLNVPQVYSCDLVEDVICASYSLDGILPKVHIWVAIVLFFVLPFVSVSLMNVKIYARIRHRRKLINDENQPMALREQNGTSTSLCSMDSITGTSSKEDSVLTDANHRGKRLRLQQYIERELTKMMVAVAVAFIFLTMPQYVRYVIYIFVDYQCSSHRYAVFALCFNITNKLFIANNAVNFYLYCMTGAKFRKDFITMMDNVVYYLKKSKCCAHGSKTNLHKDNSYMDDTNV